MMGSQANRDEQIRRNNGSKKLKDVSFKHHHNKYNPTKPSTVAKSYTPMQWRMIKMGDRK